MSVRPRLHLVAAVGKDRCIGKAGALPWRVPEDLKRFKALTMGHHLIMGRKTFDSIGKPLPGRINVVVTRNVDFSPAGVAVARSLEEAIGKAEAAGDDEIFIAGGAEIFAQALHRAGRMHLTRLHAEFEGDTFFPEFDDVNEWKLVDAEHFEPDEKNAYPYSFLTYERSAERIEPEDLLDA